MDSHFKDKTMASRPSYLYNGNPHTTNVPGKTTFILGGVPATDTATDLATTLLNHNTRCGSHECTSPRDFGLATTLLHCMEVPRVTVYTCPCLSINLYVQVKSWMVCDIFTQYTFLNGVVFIRPGPRFPACVLLHRFRSDTNKVHVTLPVSNKNKNMP